VADEDGSVTVVGSLDFRLDFFGNLTSEIGGVILGVEIEEPLGVDAEAIGLFEDVFLDVMTALPNFAELEANISSISDEAARAGIDIYIFKRRVGGAEVFNATVDAFSEFGSGLLEIRECFDNRRLRQTPRASVADAGQPRQQTQVNGKPNDQRARTTLC
jgi:hypothetical protein